MSEDKTIYSHEFHAGGSGPTLREFYLDAGRWHHRKPNSKVKSERVFKVATTVWAKRYSDFVNPQPMLFPVAKEPRVTIKQLSAQMEELRSMVAPQDRPEPTEDSLTEESMVRPEYYDLARLGPHPKYRVIDRHKIKGMGRHYVVQFETADGWSKPDFYVGVTSIADAVLPTPRERVEWYASFPSIEDADEELENLATKGTIMHALFAHCAMGMLPDFGTYEWEKHIKLQISKQGYDQRKWFPLWNTFFRKAILSFKQWVEDYRVTFLAIEIPLGIPHSIDANGNKVFGFFGQLDFIVEMDDRIWEPSKLPAKAVLPEKPKNGRKNDKKIAAGEPYVEMTPPDKKKDWAPWPADWSAMRRIDLSSATPWPKQSGADSDGKKVMEGTVGFEGFSAGGDREMPTMKCLSIPQVYVPYPDWSPSKEPDRVIAISDKKSGKHDYEEHDFQLGLQRMLLWHNFPQFRGKPIRLINWHPVDWREDAAMKSGKFSYTIYDKTNKIDWQGLELDLARWRRKHAREIPPRLVWQGNANIGEKPANNVSMVGYADYYEDLVAKARANKILD